MSLRDHTLHGRSFRPRAVHFTGIKLYAREEISRTLSRAVYFKPATAVCFCQLHYVSMPAQRASSVPATWFPPWRSSRCARPTLSLLFLSRHLSPPRYCLFPSIHFCPVITYHRPSCGRCSRRTLCVHKVEDSYPPSVSFERSHS